MIDKLRQLGLTSDMAYGASAGSILLSIAIWATEKNRDVGHAERFGIFVGLWAPTFAILGSVLEDEEREMRTTEQITDRSSTTL